MRWWENGKNKRYIWNECGNRRSGSRNFEGALDIARKALNDMD